MAVARMLVDYCPRPSTMTGYTNFYDGMYYKRFSPAQLDKFNSEFLATKFIIHSVDLDSDGSLAVTYETAGPNHFTVSPALRAELLDLRTARTLMMSRVVSARYVELPDPAFLVVGTRSNWDEKREVDYTAFSRESAHLLEQHYHWKTIELCEIHVAPDGTIVVLTKPGANPQESVGSPLRASYVHGSHSEATVNFDSIVGSGFYNSGATRGLVLVGKVSA